MRSMDRYDFTIPGRPVPKERPRMGRKGRVYTPERTLDYEQHIANIYGERGPCFTGNIAVEVVLAPEQTWVRITEVDRRASLRGDIDNYVKSILDGLQKAGAFANDRQVVQIEVDKL